MYNDYITSELDLLGLTQDFLRQSVVESDDTATMFRQLVSIDTRRRFPPVKELLQPPQGAEFYEFLYFSQVQLDFVGHFWAELRRGHDPIWAYNFAAIRVLKLRPRFLKLSSGRIRSTARLEKFNIYVDVPLGPARKATTRP